MAKVWRVGVEIGGWHPQRDPSAPSTETRISAQALEFNELRELGVTGVAHMYRGDQIFVAVEIEQWATRQTGETEESEAVKLAKEAVERLQHQHLLPKGPLLNSGAKLEDA